MSDIISRQAAIKALCEKGICGNKQCNTYPCVDVRAIEQVPTIDPVKHGKWKLAKDGWYCSVCGLNPPFDCDPEENEIPFCSNCGARMDGE